MPDFTYTGAEGNYPMLRDAYDVPAGTVKPGDVLRFDQAPDADWVPYEPGDSPQDDVGEGSNEDEDSGEAGSGQDDNDAGQPGSEEL